jgi:hypothetical protein
MTSKSEASKAGNAAAKERRIAEAAERALAEAAERRRLQDADLAERPSEHGGRDGPDPARYGDWEKAGIVSDF